MVNHFRTLLLNRDGEPVGCGPRLGDEYVPPHYRALELPGYLRNIRRILFGVSPDRVFANYRTWQLLSLLHASELVQFVLALDTRITYDVRASDLLDDAPFQIAAPTADYTILGSLGAPDATGVSMHSWQFQVLDGDTARVRRDFAPQSVVDVEYSSSGGLSSPVPLQGSLASVVFRTSVVGQTVHLSGYARPQRSLGELAADLEHSGAQYLHSLFGVGSSVATTEPFKTFRNLWYDHPELPYKLGGLLAALVYRMDQVRQGHA